VRPNDARRLEEPAEDSHQEASMKRPFLALVTLALLLVPAAQRPAWPQSPSGFLRVQGRAVIDGQGRTVVLRGINMDNFYYFYPDLPPEYGTRDDIRKLAGMGANVIRLGFHWSWFVTSDFGFNLIDRTLSWCEEAGVFVILDLHVVPPDGDVGDNLIWDDPAAQQLFVDIWTALAARYRSRTIVAGYDLYNEPGPPQASQWWDLAARTIAAIRAVDPDHILVIEPPLADPVTFQVVADSNVIYSPHDYEPFAVTHAGADWIGDSTVPGDYSYPGRVLTGVEWIGWSEDAAVLGSSSRTWRYWDSGTLTAMAGAEWASVKPFAWGRAGTVWFDDLELDLNGVAQTVWNAGAEVESRSRPGLPSDWYFYGEGGFKGSWGTQARRGSRSLQISGVDDAGYGLWVQDQWILTGPIFRVKPGDKLRVRGWILAPDNAGGCGLGIDYLKGDYEDYNAGRMYENLKPTLDWAAARNVPLYYGEFGAMRHSPGSSGYSVIMEKICIMNVLGLHWTLWSFRDTDPLGFGLYHGDYFEPAAAGVLDQLLSDVLTWGFEGFRPLFPSSSETR
jgi:hypothetical protein